MQLLKKSNAMFNHKTCHWWIKESSFVVDFVLRLKILGRWCGLLMTFSHSMSVLFGLTVVLVGTLIGGGDT